MKIILVYNGKTGFTKKYADWIAEEITCDIRPFKDLSKLSVGADDMVIFGSRVHAGRVEHLNKVKSRFGQQLVIYAVGATPASVEHVINRIWTDNLTETEIETIPHFYFQGGLNYEKMGGFDRFAMKMVARFMNGKKNKTETQADFTEAIKASHDISSKEFVWPLVDCVKEKLAKESE